MYSLVLVAAIAPGYDAHPGVGYGCGGSFGGCGGSFSGCTGYYTTGYGTCLGGGGLFGGKHRGGGMFGHRHSCLGCSGYSCSGYNCFGSCQGYHPYNFGCGGCQGYFGSGAAMGPTVAMPPYSVLGGPGYGYGCAGVYGSVTNPNPPVVVVPPDPKKDMKDEKKDDVKDMKEEKKDDVKKGGNEGMGASLRFRLPAAAALYVDGRPTAQTGAERVFSTPPLAAGRYFYDVRAELLVDGKSVVEEKRVVVEAGATVVESFGKLFAVAGGAGAVAGK